MRYALWLSGIVLITVVAYGLYIEHPVTSSDDPTSQEVVEMYVREHISELSPTPAVLGGTWYVTDISIDDGRGTVSYEDGHIAVVAEFTFAVSDEGAISILSFITREAPPPPSVQSGVRGSVTLGPTCPVVHDPPDPECADKPYATRLAITTIDGSKVVREVESDASGFFSIPLPKGTYAIRSAAAANVLPYCVAESFTVTTGFVEVVVACDTGIR